MTRSFKNRMTLTWMVVVTLVAAGAAMAGAIDCTVSDRFVVDKTSDSGIFDIARPEDQAYPEGTGGPDAYGYIYVDSEEPTGCSFAYIDISATGTNTGIEGDDSSATIPIGFDFIFYGSTYSQVMVSSNGYLTFGTAGALFTNECIPDADDPNLYIAPFWDDQSCYGADGEAIYYETFGTAPDRYLVVQFMIRDLSASTSDPVYDYEAILYENGTIKFQYNSMSVWTTGDGSEATVGIEYDGSLGLEYLCNGVPADNSTFDGLAVCIGVAENVFVTSSEAGGGPGTTVIHTITISNRTGQSDTFDLAVTASVWNTTIYVNGSPASQIGPIANDDDDTFEVRVQIPVSANIGDQDVATFTAVSQANPGTYYTEGTATTTAAVFENVWEGITACATGRSRPTLSAVGDYVYLIGGEDASKGYSASVEKYDPMVNTWTTLGAMKPTAGSNLCSDTIGTDIYVPGGYNGAAYASLEVLHTDTDTWETISTDPMPAGRLGAACAVANGKLYVFGGSDGNNYMTTCYEYDPAAAAGTRWTTKASMSVGRAYLGGASLDGKIYAIGGLLTGSIESNAVEEFDPQTNTWTTKTNLPAARGGCNAVSGLNLGYAEDDFIIIGGGGWSSYQSTCWAYNPVTDAYLEYPSMITGRRTFGFARSTDRIYSVAGWAGTYMTAAEKIDCHLMGPVPTATPVPPTDTPVPPTDTPVPPTDTPIPVTMTPTPAPATGVELEMPGDMFHMGDEVYLKAYITSGEPEVMTNVPFVCVLDINVGVYWFYPGWQEYPPTFDYETITLTPGMEEKMLIDVFYWPDTGDQTFTGATFLSAMLNEDLTELFGALGQVSFGWGPM
ncbi:hypothetical protein JW905_19160 [bacterium]|nr:hypothetical protein [candidate division CSSED10-310 bacterium]